MDNYSNKIIFIDDDEDLRDAQVQGLRLENYDVLTFSNGIEALANIDKNFNGIVITDIRMPILNGLEVFEKIKEIDSEIPVILITGHGDVSLAVSAIKQGAWDVITKPYSFDIFLQAISRALQKRHLVLENRQLKELSTTKAMPIDKIIGNSQIMQNLRSNLKLLTNVDVDILIKGESGTGKLMAAKAIHHQGIRRKRPLIIVNCANLPQNLFTTFSYKEDAFNAQNRFTKTIVQSAHHGTLILKDIELLPLKQQAQLFNIIENKEFISNNNEAQYIDIRLIATSSKNLLEEVKKGNFRQDLYYRISGTSIEIPPIRERREDIFILFKMFLLQACARLRIPAMEVDSKNKVSIISKEWAGNVREIEQFSERFALGLNEKEISQDNINNYDLNLQINSFEAEYIKNCLAQTNGNIARAIELLNIPRRTLYDKLKKHGIDPDDYR